MEEDICTKCKKPIADGDAIVKIDYGNMFGGGEKEYVDSDLYHDSCVVLR